MRIASRARSLLIATVALTGLCLLTVSASHSSSIDVIVNKVDSSYETISQKISQTKLSSLKRRLRINTEKAYARFIAVVADNDQKLIAQVILTKIQQRSQEEIIPTQDLVLIRQVINATNSEREARGLAPLGFNYRLTMAAYRHARDLRDHFPYDTNGDGIAEKIAHAGSDGSTATERAESLGYNRLSIAENVAYNQITVDEVMDDRMQSPDHQENILSETVIEMGVAKVGPYRVQVFGKERRNK